MKVNIQPTVNMLQILRHVEYKAWYALAEYVDNSLQSYLDNQGSIEGPLRVNIEINRPNRTLTIQDNAAGISGQDLERALRAASVPPKQTGYNEFGMGMKSASCWFSADWTIRTTCKGDKVARSVRFDLDRIAASGQVELDVIERPARIDDHGTTIELNEVKDLPQGRTLGKIRDHLRDIYRLHLRERFIELVVADQELGYEDPEFLHAKTFNRKRQPIEDSPAIEWKKPIVFELKDGRVVEGTVGLLAKGNTSKAGLILFRRRRAIQGTGEDPYRPEDIFGRGNSFESQRLWGELNLEDFEVSHTKDGIKWEGAEPEFIQKLRIAIEEEPLPLLQQARNFRAKHVTNENEAVGKVMARALDNLVTSAETTGHDLDGIQLSKQTTDPRPELPAAPEFELAKRTFSITLPESQQTWHITVELSSKILDDTWMEYAGNYDENVRQSTVHIRLLMNSPFMQNIVKIHDQDSLEPVIRIAAALGLAECLARQGASSDQASIRRSMGKLLSSSLAENSD